MEKFIFCFPVEKKYIILTFYFILAVITINIIINFMQEYYKYNIYELNDYMSVFRFFIRYFIFSLFIIPELIMKKIYSSKRIKNDLKHKYKLKDYAVIGLISLILLINHFSDVFLNIYLWKREKI